MPAGVNSSSAIAVNSALSVTPNVARGLGLGADPPGARSSSNLSEGRLVRIYAGQLFDPDTLQLLPRCVVTVSHDSGLVLDVRPYSDQQLEADKVDFADTNAVVDLRSATVLPGLVDAHVHSECFLRLRGHLSIPRRAVGSIAERVHGTMYDVRVLTVHGAGRLAVSWRFLDQPESNRLSRAVRPASALQQQRVWRPNLES